METRKMHIQGMEVQVEGAGPRTVLMLHGWPDTLAVWDGTSSRPAKQLPVCAFDAPRLR